jgi:Holliday junction resolvase RusA-like endonuclease
MSGISVWVDGAPKGQPRPRAFVFRGHARVYDAGTAEGWKAAVATALKPWAQARMEGPLRVALCFQFLRPASHRTGKGALRKGAPVAHTGKPDTDNLAKAVLDCCSAIGIWHDDAQITDLLVTKDYDDQREGCAVTIQPALVARGALTLREE